MSYFKRYKDMVDSESTSQSQAIYIAFKYAIGFTMLAVQLIAMFVLHVAVGAYGLLKEKLKNRKETVDEDPENLYNYKIDK
jgi:predicted transport protein